MRRLYTTLYSLVLAAAASAQSSTTVGINPSVSYQTMRDFGASDCWTADYVGRYFGDAEKQKAARWLFSTETDANGNPQGIGLTVWRVNLGAGSSTQGADSNIEDKTRRADCFLNTDGKIYNWANAAGQQWFMQQAKSYGVPNFIFFSNSPLIYHTRNGLANNKDWGKGVNLRDDRYDDFAEYLAECTAHFAGEGYNITHVSPVNEPAFDWVNGQEGTPWQNAEIARLVRELNTSLNKRSLSAQILLPEASAWDRLYRQSGDYGDRASNQIEAFWNRANTATYIGDQDRVAHIAAGHSYWTFRTNDELQNVRTAVAQAAAKYGLETSQTEWSMLDAEPSTTAGFPRSYDAATYMDIALYMGKIIHCDLTYAQSTSWSYWTAMAQEKWGQKNRFYLLRLNAKGDAGNESYGDIETGGTVTDSKSLWVLGNYSRFVRPGYQRIDMKLNNSGLNGLMGSAYISPEKDKVVVVFVNMGYARRNVSFAVDGYEVTSIDTYTTDADRNLAHAEHAVTDRLNLPKGTVTTVVMNISQTAGVATAPLAGTPHDGAYYTLSGMRLDAADASQLPRGIYIYNGKKIIRK